MTKQTMIKELYREIHGLRFLHGFCCKKAEEITGADAERFQSRAHDYEMQVNCLTAYAHKIAISPLLKGWYASAFDAGMAANSTGEHNLPAELEE
jgi:hypothetical protein